MAFVHELAAERLAGLPTELVLADIRAFASRRPDLVVEMAHPAVTRHIGEMFLQADRLHAALDDCLCG